MLRMTIEGVGFDRSRLTYGVLKDWGGQKLLPIWIGPAEARSIALHLDGTTPPRPLAHDLLMSCIQHAGGRVTRVVINDLQDSTFYATIDIDTSRGLLHIDARPSDAIAVAVRAKCPVFVDGGALEALLDISNAREGEDGGENEGADGDELPFATPLADDEEFAADASSASTRSGPSSSPAAAAPDDDIDRFKRLVSDLDL